MPKRKNNTPSFSQQIKPKEQRLLDQFIKDWNDSLCLEKTILEQLSLKKSLAKTFLPLISDYNERMGRVIKFYASTAPVQKKSGIFTSKRQALNDLVILNRRLLENPLPALPILPALDALGMQASYLNGVLEELLPLMSRLADHLSIQNENVCFCLSEMGINKNACFYLSEMGVPQEYMGNGIVSNLGNAHQYLALSIWGNTSRFSFNEIHSIVLNFCEQLLCLQEEKKYRISSQKSWCDIEQTIQTSLENLKRFFNFVKEYEYVTKESLAPAESHLLTLLEQSKNKELNVSDIQRLKGLIPKQPVESISSAVSSSSFYQLRSIMPHLGPHASTSMSR